MKMSIQANTTILPPKEKKKANAHSKKKEPSPHPSKQIPQHFQTKYT
jgi:hypothetical protein